MGFWRKTGACDLLDFLSTLRPNDDNKENRHAINKDTTIKDGCPGAI